jgi:hypothetical protein
VHVVLAAATTQPTTIHHQRCAFARREHLRARTSWCWRRGPRAQECTSLRRRSAARPQWSPGLLRMQGPSHSTGKHLCPTVHAVMLPCRHRSHQDTQWDGLQNAYIAGMQLAAKEWP